MDTNHRTPLTTEEKDEFIAVILQSEELLAEAVIRLTRARNVLYTEGYFIEVAHQQELLDRIKDHIADGPNYKLTAR